MAAVVLSEATIVLSLMAVVISRLSLNAGGSAA